MNRFSAIIPYYNGDIGLLAKTVGSILAQTHQNFDIFIINDGSNAELTALLPNKIVALNPHRIRILHTVNQGQGAARILGATTSTSEYLAFCDADDLWHSEKLKQQLDFLKLHPEFNAVVHPMHKIDARGTIVGKVVVPFDPQENDTSLATFIALLYNNPFPTSSVVCKREAFLAARQHVIVGKDINNDRTLWLAMAWNGSRFGLIEDCLGYYRVHDKNFSKEIFINYNHKFSHVFHFLDLSKQKLIDLGYDYEALRKDVLHHTHIRYASRLYKNGKKREAVEAVKESLRYKRSFKAFRRYVKYALTSVAPFKEAP